MDSDSEDLNVLNLPEASGSDVTDSDDDSDSSEGRWVMYKSPAKGKEAANPLPNGQKHERKQSKADDPDSMSSGKVSRQKKKTKASESEPEAGASQPEMQAAKKRKVAKKGNDEPITVSEAPVKRKKSKKKPSADEDVFAPAEEYEDMLREDAPLQTASKGSKGSCRTRAKVQSKGSKLQEHADTGEEYEWG